MKGTGITLACAALLLFGGSAARAFEQARTKYNVRWKWPSSTIAVQIDVADKDAARRAIAAWNATGCVTLVEADGGVLIRSGIPVEGAEGFAAHTRLEGDERRGTIARATVTVDPHRSIDIESVILHELGHALGLAHAKERDAVMAAGTRLRRALHDDDIRGVCAIYPLPEREDAKRSSQRGRQG